MRVVAVAVQVGWEKGVPGVRNEKMRRKRRGRAQGQRASDKKKKEKKVETGWSRVRVQIEREEAHGERRKGEHAVVCTRGTWGEKRQKNKSGVVHDKGLP